MKAITSIFIFLSIPLFSSDFMLISGGLYPTTYYIVDENTFSCEGYYLNHYYDGTERTILKDSFGGDLAKVCTRFSRALAMEGTGILRDRRTINWAGNFTYRVVDKCKYGIGVNHLCLLPFYTIAADIYSYEENELIYIKEAVGILLPDGSRHTGYFLIRDTGAAFTGHENRIDIFVSTQTDEYNIFKTYGFTLSTALTGYRVKGKTKEKVLEEFEEKFGELMGTEKNFYTN